MTQTRRAFLATFGAALALPAFAQSDFPAAANPGFDRWVAKFRLRAASQGIAARTLDAAFSQAGFLPGVIDKENNQYEFSLSLEDYLAITASDERIAAGKAALRRQAQLLSQIEKAYGVEAHVIAAVWGIESFYGTKRGTVPVISALATLSYASSRAAFFEGQLIAALRILQHGDVTPDRMTGGWAGAMGHTQFIPTTYLAYAVDFRGDGRRDIWGDDPTDALASAANYLARAGWSYGQPWGVEVLLPPGFNRALAGNLRRRSTGDWAKLGVRTATGNRLVDHGTASVILPAAATGPAFLVFHNYSVIAAYNASQKYVIGLGHLADRIHGGPPELCMNLGDGN